MPYETDLDLADTAHASGTIFGLWNGCEDSGLTGRGYTLSHLDNRRGEKQSCKHCLSRHWAVGMRLAFFFGQNAI